MSVRDLTLMLGVASLVLLSACGSRGRDTTPTAASLRVRYAPPAGAIYDQEISVALKLKVSSAGVSGGLAALVQSLAGDVRQDTKIRGQLVAGQRAEDGSQPVSLRIVEAVGTVTGAGQTRDMPQISAIAGTPPMEGRVAPDGRQIDLGTAADSGDAGLSPAVRDRLLEAMPPLPEKEMTIGDSFEAKIPLTLPGPGGRGENRTETLWTYTLRSVSPAEALFDVRQVLPDGARVELKGGRTLALSGGAAGTATFSRSEGLFTAIRMEADFQLLVGLPSVASLLQGGANAPADTSPLGGSGKSDAATGGVQLQTSVQGPVALTLTRTAAR